MRLVVFGFALLVAVVNGFAGAPVFRFGPSPSLSSRVSVAVRAEAVGKAELVDILKEKTGVAKKDVDAIISALSPTIKELVLEQGMEIRLRDFGTFKRKVSSARVGRNPRTGDEIQISGGKSVGFTVSSSLKVKDA